METARLISPRHARSNWHFRPPSQQRPKIFAARGNSALESGRSRPGPIRCWITYSVFRLAARRTELRAKARRLETAPVSEKRVGLSRCPRRPSYGRLMVVDRLEVRAIGFLRLAGWPISGPPPGFRVARGGCAGPLRRAPARRRPRRPERPGPDLAGGPALRDVEASDWAHDVSGTDWQILALSMQPITTMMPVWQCGHSRNECPVSTS